MITVMHPAFVVEPEQEDVAAANEVTRRLEAALMKLSPREERVVRLKMKGASFRQIGEELGVTTTRADQIFDKSVWKIRRKAIKAWVAPIVDPAQAERDRVREAAKKRQAEYYARRDIEATRRLERLQIEQEMRQREQAAFQAELAAKIANPHHDEKLGEGALFFASTNITVNFSKTGRPPVYIGQFEVWKMHPKLAANAEAMGQGVVLVTDD